MAGVKGLRKEWQVRKQPQGILGGCACRRGSLQLLLVWKSGFLSDGKMKPSLEISLLLPPLAQPLWHLLVCSAFLPCCLHSRLVARHSALGTSLGW